MVSPQWDQTDEAQQALRAIVSDPRYGVAALSSAQIMANLLKDLLPDAPREVSILVAAAEAGVAGNLRDRVSQGMDVGTASAVVAGSFAASTPFRPEACSWAVSEIAGALGLSSPVPSPSPIPSPPPVPSPPAPSPPPGSSIPPRSSAPPTIISAPLAAAGPGAAPVGYPPGAGAADNPTAAGPGVYPTGAVPGGFPVATLGSFPPGAAPGGFPPVAAPGGFPPGAAPGGFPPGAAPGGFPPAGQVSSPGPYPAAPPLPGNAPGGYQAASGYPSPSAPGYQPQPPAPGFVPVARTNGLAIASLVLGVLWLFWLGSVVGLVLGLVALKQIRTRNQGGRGIAIAGIVLSILWLLVLVVAIVAGAKAS